MSMGGRRAWRVRARSHVARKRPREGLGWPAIVREHDCDQPDTGSAAAVPRDPRVLPGSTPQAFSRKAWNRPETTCDRQLKASALASTNLTPVKTPPNASPTSPTYGDPNFSPRRDLAKRREQPTWPAAWHRARRRSHRQSASSPFTRLRCAAARRAARPSTALPLPAPTAMEHKVVLERTDLLQKPIRKEVERRKIEADRRRNITTDGG